MHAVKDLPACLAASCPLTTGFAGDRVGVRGSSCGEKHCTECSTALGGMGVIYKAWQVSLDTNTRFAAICMSQGQSRFDVFRQATMVGCAAWSRPTIFRHEPQNIQHTAHFTFSTFPLLIDRASACTIRIEISVDAMVLSTGFSPWATQSTMYLISSNQPSVVPTLISSADSSV